MIPRRKLSAVDVKRRDFVAAYARLLAGDPCCYCGAPANPKHQLDHIEPLDGDGIWEWTNLTRACNYCNASKCAKPLLEFLLYRKRWGQTRPGFRWR
jgi:5-methylcytosine-specific restriction endonuclease McrA